MTTTTTPGPLTGGCHCGLCRYTISSLPARADLVYCHCHTCQRLSGSAFLPFIQASASALHWERSESLTELVSSSDATRTFCNRCGSPLSMVYGQLPDAVYIVCGSLDPEGGGRLKELMAGEGKDDGEVRHIFTGERAVWER